MPPLDQGRECYARRAWDEAWRWLDEADRAQPLDPEDLERLGWAAALTARDAQMLATFERLHHHHLEGGRAVRAARMAFWLGMRLLAAGEQGRASGWLTRAGRLVEDVDCVERGYLLVPRIHRHLAAGEVEEAQATAASAVEIATRFGEADLLALGRNLQGRSLVRLGRVEAGLALMDEAMVAATAGEVSALVTGLVYCNVIACCQSVHAVDRSREWTTTLSRWCESQPQLVLFGGTCLVHRSEILQLGGAWASALEEATRVTERSVADPVALGDAHYQRAEIDRLRGEFAAAEEGYRAASHHGREPQPGLALLRVAQGRPDAACSALRRILDATPDPFKRTRYLSAWVEIELAAGDLDAADRACTELEQVVGTYRTELLGALARVARGQVQLARGDARAAIQPLRSAFEAWQRLSAPYLAARTRSLLGRACLDLGDADGAALEFEAARAVFAQLGARPDLDALPVAGAPGHGLTPRELEVLRHVAAGETNKDIARALFVSAKTVDRHVSNLFAKLGLSSRAAATAWAYQHDIVPRG